MADGSVNLGGKVIDNAGDPKVGLTVELYEAAIWEAGGATTATDTTGTNGRWNFDAQDITKTWIVVIKDGLLKFIIDARNELQMSELDLIVALNTDTIYEHTADAGVTVDGLLIKDGEVAAGGVAFDDATSDPLIDANSAADGTEDSVARKDHVHLKHHA